MIVASSGHAATRRAIEDGLAGREARVLRLPAGSRLQAAVRRSTPPELLVVDLDGVPSVGAEMRALLGCLAPGTAVVALVTDTGPHVAVELVRSGAADVLVKPIGAGAVRAVVSRIIDTERRSDVLPDRAGRVVAVSGSSGSGVSSLCVGLARLAYESADSSVLIGCEPLGPRLGPLFDTARTCRWPDASLPDDELSSGAVVVERPVGTSLPRAFLYALLTRCANASPSVVLCAGGSTELSVRLDAFSCADAAILLVEPSVESVACCAQHLGALGSHLPVLCVLSYARSSRAPLSAAQVSYGLGDRKIAVVLPHDSGLAASGPAGAGRRWCSSVSMLCDLTGLRGL